MHNPGFLGPAPTSQYPLDLLEQVLLVLIRSASRIVTLDAVTDAVGKLGKALNGSRTQPRFLETVASRGYRLSVGHDQDVVDLFRKALQRNPTRTRARFWLIASLV